MNDDFNNGGRQSANFRYPCDQFTVQKSGKGFPSLIAFGLSVVVQISNFFLKERYHVRITVARGCHCLDDISRITRVIVSVIGDEASVLLIRREEPIAA